MLRLRPTSQLLIILLCIGIVMMRASGAHLHYCFDGSEPPVSLHIDNHAGSHHKTDSVASEEHADVDVSLGLDILIKKAPTPLDLLGLIAALSCFIWLLPRIRAVALSADCLIPFFIRRAYLRPPLRGPPR